MWRYQGALTLASFLRKGDALAALSRALAVPRSAVTATVMLQIMTATQVFVCALELLQRCAEDHCLNRHAPPSALT